MMRSVFVWTLSDALAAVLLLAFFLMWAYVKVAAWRRKMKGKK